MDRPDGFHKPQQKGAKTLVSLSRSSRAVAVQSAVAKKRKKAQKAEFRTLTQATRRRRRVWGVSIASIGALIIGVTVLTLSPALALKTITVEGTKRLDASQIEQALQPLYGEPLARVSAERIAQALKPLTLIQAFRTRIDPPHTLVVTIVEREPLGFIPGSTGFLVLDAAGVTLWSQPEEPTELPRLGSSPDRNASGFSAITRVLAALPADLLAQVDFVRATTLDDVRFSMRSSDHEVVWGSAERAGEKAIVLQASLVAAGSGDSKVIDVTTPESVVIRDKD